MSWLSNLTGSKSQQPPPPSDAQEKAKEKRDAAEVLQKAREVRNSGSYQAFDPEGLERAAKAIKELNQSPHARSAIDLQRDKERTDQLKIEESIGQAKAYEEEYKIKLAQVQGEERLENQFRD
ncbi:ATPase family AAA domain-containing protein 3-like [Convolutriloba macropyga]|uniref:ATPase family AAA domain-containing protein 3-like n=1 Tax=Convolutriloba macropyga TaxID=536237 RepID=UPI003F527B75